MLIPLDTSCDWFGMRFLQVTGYYRIEGELKKLGFDVSLTTVRNVLDRNGILPAPVRYGSIGWKTMMKHYKEQLLCCDFFVVESLFLKTYYNAPRILDKKRGRVKLENEL